MPEHADVVVVGLGVMGSAATAALARSGRSVVGVDARSPAHRDTASAGESRMLRRAYPSHPEYGPLTEPARTAWLRLQERTGARVFLPTGGLLIDRPQGIEEAVRAAERDGAPYRVVTGPAYPPLRSAPDAVGFLDVEAGVLLAEPAVLALQAEAVGHGARLRFGAPVDPADLLDHWTRHHEAAGVRADRLVLALGAWQPTVGAWPPTTLERTVSFWLDPGGHDLGRLPFTEWNDPDFCLLPALPRGVKVKFHHTGEPTGHPPRPPDAAEVDAARTRLRDLTGLDLQPRDAVASCYANTPDGRFVVAPHPDAPDVVVVSACSGHGFKFAPVLADRVVTLTNERRAA